MRAGRLLLAAVLVALATAASPSAGSIAGVGVSVDTGTNYNGGKALSLAAGTRAKALAAARAVRGNRVAAAVGDEQLWLGLDDALGFIYLKEYTLRGIGDHIEVWVASDADEVSSGISFPAGDCRNDERVVITDAQIQSLIREFDRNMYPKESAAFSVPPDRDGTFSIASDLGLPPDYFSGEGDNIVALIDNVRDANFYDFPTNATYIAGFFYSLFNEYLDRNIMTIDAFDWLHRTGAEPPNAPVAGDPCASKPARPRLYESTFAHEYQHLLEYYEDADETSWINEGLSMYAEALTGYVDPRIPVSQTGFQSSIQCFLGWGSVETPANPNPRAGGAENSLTLWGDQGDGDEVLCDYGAAESFMHYLLGRFGPEVLSALHDEDSNGLDSVRAVLKGKASTRDRREILHDWAAMVALDHFLDEGYRGVGPYGRYRTPTLDLNVDWDNTDAYSTPGAPPNGSDYVRLRGGSGNFLTARQIRSISFDGAATHTPLPIEWGVDSSPAGHEGNPALYSGSGPNFDRTIVFEASVPADDPTLTFETLYDTEPLWDYAFVQVSTDGGKTYKSVGNDLTTTDHDPGAIELVVQNLPGLTGISGSGEAASWIETSYDLTKYAGKSVLIAFRYITDSGVDLPGWWVDNVRLGDQVVSDGESLKGFRSTTEISPIPVEGFTVQLIGYFEDRPREAFLHRLKLNSHFDGRIGGKALRRLLGKGYDVVAAIVTYDEPTELIPQYAPYKLWVAADDVQQPGGGERRVLQRGG